MLGGVNTEHEQQIFSGQRWHGAPGHDDLASPVKKGCDVEIEAVETRGHSPLQVQQISSGGAVEHVAASGANVGWFFAGAEIRLAGVAHPKQRGFCFRYIRRKDQDIEIAKLALSDFAVQSFRQDWALEGQSLDSG